MGLLAGHYLKSKTDIALFLAVIIISEIIIIRFNRMKVFFVLSIFTVLGMILAFKSITPKSEIAERFVRNGVEVYVEGIVSDEYISENGYQVMNLRKANIYTDNANTNDKFNITAVCEKGVNIENGMTVKIKGVIEKGDEAPFPGMFSQSNYMYYNGYDYSIFGDTFEITSKNIQKDFYWYIENLRYCVNEKIDTILPVREGGILKAMITGEKRYIDEYYTDIFKKAGISHILAVSGLHMSVVSGFIYFLFSVIFRLSRRISSLITIPFIIMFMIFCGCTPSVVRACIMSIIILIGNIIREESDILNSVAVAALIILIVSPESLYSISFQLSFMAAIGIGMGNEISERFDNINSFVKSVAFISMGANIMTLPLCMYYFYGVSIASLFLNIIVIPVAGIIVIMGFISVITSFLIHSLGVFLAGTVFVLINFIKLLAAMTENSKYLYIETGSINIIAVLLFYITFIWIFVFIDKKYIRCLSFVTALLFSFIINYDYIFKKNELAFIDVGKGNSAVYTTYDGFTAVVDGGGHFLDFGNNTGVNDVIPYLEYKGEDSVDVLFISNMNEYNAKGAIEIIENFNVKNVIIPKFDFAKTGIYTRLVESTFERNIPLYEVSFGDSINLNNKAEFEILYPFLDYQIYDGNENHSSIVMKFKDRENTILFTGDIEKSDQNLILSKNIDLKSDIVKIPAYTDFIDDFVKDVSPDIGIISSNEDISNNIKDVLDKCHIKYYNTSVNKSLVVELYSDFYKIKPVIETE